MAQIAAMAIISMGLQVASKGIETYLTKQDTKQGPGEARRDYLQLQSCMGLMIPRVWGTDKIGGNIIWASKIDAVGYHDADGNLQYYYYISLAIGVVEGPAARILEVWADDQKINPINYCDKYTEYLGTETQDPDPTISAALGGDEFTPAYRGLCYVVFKRLWLNNDQADRLNWNGNIPNLLFKVTDGSVPQCHVTLVEHGTSAIETWGQPAPDGASAIILDGTTWRKLRWSDRVYSDYQDYGTCPEEFDFDDGSSYLGTRFFTAVPNGGSPAESFLAQIRVYDLFLAATSDNYTFPTSDQPFGIRTAKTHGWVFWIESSGANVCGVPISTFSTFEFPYQITADGGYKYKCMTAVEWGDYLWVFCYEDGGFGTGQTKWYRMQDSSPEVTLLATHVTTAEFHCWGENSEVRMTATVIGEDPVKGTVEIRVDVIMPQCGPTPIGTMGFFTALMTTLGTASTLHTLDWRGKCESDDAFKSATHQRGIFSAIQRGEVDGAFIYPATRYQRLFKIDCKSMTASRLVDAEISLEWWDLWLLGRGTYDGEMLAGAYPPSGTAGLFLIDYRNPLPAPCQAGIVIQEVCEGCGLHPTEEVDVGQISHLYLDGFTLTSRGNGQTALQPVVDAFVLDLMEYAGRLRYRERQTNASMEIKDSDLAEASDSSSDDPRFSWDHSDPADLPGVVEVTYRDTNRDYEQNIARAFESDSASADVMGIDLPVAFKEVQALESARNRLTHARESNEKFRYRLARRFSVLDPGDAVVLTVDGEQFTMRVEQMSMEGGSVLFDCVGQYVKINSTAGCRVTQLAAEVFRTGPGAARISQIAVEVLRTGEALARVVQLGVKVLRTK